MANPTITVPRIITRGFIKQHPEWTFIYGADLLRKGALGQMYSCHGEPNAFPMTTCVKLCPSSLERYWSDSDERGWDQLQIDMDMLSTFSKSKIFLPLRKIGEGYSEMYIRAPRLFKFMKDFLDAISYKPLKIDYKC